MRELVCPICGGTEFQRVQPGRFTCGKCGLPLGATLSGSMLQLSHVWSEFIRGIAKELRGSAIGRWVRR